MTGVHATAESCTPNPGSRVLLVLLVVAVSTVLAPPAVAGCWECDTIRERCESADGDGYEGCYDYTVCSASCEIKCDTSGDECVWQELPDGPESQGLIVPNGELLPWTAPEPEPATTRCSTGLQRS